MTRNSASWVRTRHCCMNGENPMNRIVAKWDQLGEALIDAVLFREI